MRILIRGINRQIIEVAEIGNTYYERAFLFLKPEYMETQKDILEKEAKTLLRNIGKPASIKKRKKFLYWSLRLGGSAIAGSLLTALLLNI